MTLKFKPKITKKQFNELVEKELLSRGITGNTSPSIVNNIEKELLRRHTITNYTPLPENDLNVRTQFAITGQTTRGGKIKTRSHKPKAKHITRKNKGGLKGKEKKKKKSFSRTLYKVNRFLKNKTQSKK